MKIKNYSYSLTDYGDLEIFITDNNDNEFVLATISNCREKKDFELDNMAQEIIEEMGYEFE